METIPPDGAPAPIWNVSGHVIVRAFDAHRVLIAVDSTSEGRKADGVAEHVMLATTTDDAAPAQRFDAEGTMEVQGGVVRLTLSGEAKTIVLLYGPAPSSSGAVAGYVVAATRGLSDSTGQTYAMSDLAAGGVPVPCDDAASSGCFRLPSGRVIQFPL